MTQQQPNDEVLEQAALYALGLLQGQEKDTFEKLVTEGCTTCQAVKDFQKVANFLGTAATPVPPPSSLRATLLKRIAAEQETHQQALRAKPAGPLEDAGLTFVRSVDDLWKEILPGILLKPLFLDKAHGRMTALARMAPHSRYAPHKHTAPEEFYVLEGTCFIGGQLLHEGDYHRAEVGTVHHETSTENGCLMLMIFSPKNEILEVPA
ncbi:MAG: cupin domain-containing protein [Nitrospirales bacterium]|nr:cupin domain-containing protein [Nitrospira sp.]MDR4483333.1 cupin domain-containing protein [Nitrospirales bacterium]